MLLKFCSRSALIQQLKFSRYIHNQDWDNAARVAELHDPDSVSDVLVGQAKYAFSQNNLQRFESLLLRAHKPDLIVKQYKVRNQI